MEALGPPPAPPSPRAPWFSGVSPVRRQMGKRIIVMMYVSTRAYDSRMHSKILAVRECKGSQLPTTMYLLTYLQYVAALSFRPFFFARFFRDAGRTAGHRCSDSGRAST